MASSSGDVVITLNGGSSYGGNSIGISWLAPFKFIGSVSEIHGSEKVLGAASANWRFRTMFVTKRSTTLFKACAIKEMRRPTSRRT